MLSMTSRHYGTAFTRVANRRSGWQALLGHSGEGCCDGTSQRGQQEAATVHAGTVGRAEAKVNHVTPGP
jgi:hypothetical protein